ncbi:MAG: major tail protein [Candidatus Limiplasma sp.]|nr:major tail protein [Candidatus Limiplasma sp.]
MPTVAYYEGIADMYCAKMVQEETLQAPPVYGAVQLLGIGVSYKIAAKYTEGTLPGGNRNLRERKRLTSYEVELNVDRVRQAVLESFEGRERDANGVCKIGAADAPYMALLFAVPLDDGTQELWVLYKGKLLAPDLEMKTRDGKYEWQTPTVKGTFGVRNDLGIPGMCCETGDEAVSAPVKTGWFTAPYAPVSTYSVVAIHQPDDLALTAGAIGTGAILVFVADGSADGAPAYQWYSNAADSNAGGVAIVGATAEAYAIPTDTAEGTYHYYCVATYHGVSVTSDVASVVVAA